jgi:hypothetical protein
MSEKFYLAGRYGRREEIADYAAQLGNVVSEWLYGDKDTYAESAARDLSNLDRATTLVVFTELPVEYANAGGLGGCHVEFGYALGQGKRVVVIGPRCPIFHYLSVVEHYDTWEEFMDHEEVPRPVIICVPDERFDGFVEALAMALANLDT